MAELEAAGLRFVGRDESGRRMEITELPVDTHPFYLGVQYHPEFKSRPLMPSPPFHGLVAAAIGDLEGACKAPSETPRTAADRAHDLGLA